MIDDAHLYIEPSRVIDRERETQPPPPISEGVQVALALHQLRTRVSALVGSLPQPVDYYRMAGEALQTAAYWLQQAAEAEPKE